MLREYCSFDSLISSTLIKVLFWVLSICICFVGAAAAFLLRKHGIIAYVGFACATMLAIVVLRVLCELLIVIFLIYDTLRGKPRTTLPESKSNGMKVYI